MNKKEKFTKHDQGKIRYSLLPRGGMEAIVKVLEYGIEVEGYKIDNWQNCPDKIRYYNASIRHIEKWLNGVTKDSKSKLPHLDHAICCLMFISWMERQEDE